MGSVEVILGSMYAEKSTELIKRVRRHEIANKKCLVFKHSLDCKRNNQIDIITHNQHRYDAVAVNSIKEIYDQISGQVFDVIAIDEVQFFDDEVIGLARYVSQKLGGKIILAGLDMDYNGEPFGVMGMLCCIADNVTKLHAVCMSCGKDAKYSYRKTDEKGRISIGATDKYEALCEYCYLERKNN